MANLGPIILLALLCTTILADPASAAQTSGTGTQANWNLPPVDYFIKALPPPPRQGSFRDRMDYRDALAQQRLVTSEDKASIQETYLFSVFYFSNVFGPNFTARKYPRTASFFSALTAKVNVLISDLKEHYKRPRPFVTHSDIQLMVRNEPGYSYPSGHTTRSRLCALIVEELDPSAKAAVAQAAERVALDRILAGEHYQTDLEAGRRLAKLIFRALKNDPAFFQALVSLRESPEWTPPPPLTAQ